MAVDSPIPAASEIEEGILGFLQRELLGPHMMVGRNDDLLSGAVLDSMSVLRLAAFVGEEFRIAIRPSDFTIENFRTVAAVAGYVRRALTDGVPEASRG